MSNCSPGERTFPTVLAYEVARSQRMADVFEGHMTVDLEVQGVSVLRLRSMQVATKIGRH
jgi:hypothetical protein